MFGRKKRKRNVVVVDKIEVNKKEKCSDVLNKKGIVSMASGGNRFRVLTINVHGFVSGSTLRFKNNVNELVSILNPLQLDLIAVEEVLNDSNWKEFGDKLGLKSLIFDATYGDHHGNGFVSRYPIKSWSSERSSFACAGGRRGILQCSVDHPLISNRLFGVTHLDHRNEDDRLKQIKQFSPHKTNIDILFGDMNALTRQDYSDRYLRENILFKREKSSWERPRFDLTRLITEEWGYEDAFTKINPTLKDEQVVTCDYGTRIDYIYLHPRLNEQWTLSQCQIIDTKGATDHNAIFAEFQIKTN